jgi:periplasmic protein TonB
MDWREARGTRLARWAGGLALVATVHAAGAAYSLWQGEPEDADPEGVFVIELASVTTSAHTATHAMTPGPESVDSVEARPAAPQERTIEERILDLPPLPPRPAVPQDLILPERVVEKPPERKEPEEELPLQKEVVSASQASVASRPLKIDDAAQAEKTTAPITGLSQQDARTKSKWQRELVAHLGRFKSYPAASRDRREIGQIMLKFELDRSGRVSNAGIARTSGHPLLDAAALDMLNRASPLPPPPESVPGTKIELAVPVKFQLKD